MYFGSLVVVVRVTNSSDFYSFLLPLKTYEQAVDNAKRLTEGDLENLELARGPAEANRRRAVLNQVRYRAVSSYSCKGRLIARYHCCVFRVRCFFFNLAHL